MHKTLQLIQIIFDRKFKAAAAKLEVALMSEEDIDAAIQAWSEYPASFGQYPTRIVRTKTKWTDNSVVPVPAFAP